MRGIVWFREDLRTHDHTSLYHALQKCDEGIVGIYVIDPSMWHEHDVAPCRIEFILRGLNYLSNSLRKLNISLVIINVNKTSSIPREILKIFRKIKAHALFFNKQYEVNESKRDQAVINYLKKNDINCYSFDDQVILPPGSVLNRQGEYFKIFTPFKLAWYQVFNQRNGIKLLSAPKKQDTCMVAPSPIPTRLSGFHTTIDPKLWPAGEHIAQQRLKHFIDKQLMVYDKQRDFPALDGTSKLSPYLATGMISPRQCFLAALNANQNELDSGRKATVIWMTELIWREFYKHILVAFPRVSMNKPFKLITEKLPWHYHKNKLEAWQQGQTGYPIIDAAMRQLNMIGWMHNRLRMIVAMFLSKNLFLDWRLGERYFMQHLIDGDLAANNGGWQWCASTGTDAAPYFRIFNPISQSERFDPKGDFIRHYCPELSQFDDHSIHDPYGRDPKLAQIVHYPDPIINLQQSRKQTLAAFKKLNKK